MANKECPVCGAMIGTFEAFKNELSDGTRVCEKCAAKTRFLYPMELEVYFDDEYLENEASMKNPVGNMTLEQFRQAIDETDKKRASEISEYKGYKGVLIVDSLNCSVCQREDHRWYYEDGYEWLTGWIAESQMEE